LILPLVASLFVAVNQTKNKRERGTLANVTALSMPSAAYSGRREGEVCRKKDLMSSKAKACPDMTAVNERLTTLASWARQNAGKVMGKMTLPAARR
jgi:hypothetical protein